MKNKYLKGSHISERKMNELLTLYCQDHTATEIAAITGISRITINAYLKLLRNHIAAFCEEKRPATVVSSNGDLRNTKSPADDQAYLSPRKNLLRIIVSNDFVYTETFDQAESDAVVAYIKTKGRVRDGSIAGLALHSCNAIADLNSLKLYPSTVLDGEFGSNNDSIPEEAVEFWNLLRARIVKFRGLNNSTLSLHVRETEFRYNYRNENIYSLLLGMIQKKPLHLSRAVKNIAV